jgi:hypothetical protein
LTPRTLTITVVHQLSARIHAVLLLALAGGAQAAEITRTASSFEPNDPFGMYVDVGYQFQQQRGKIVREWYQEPVGIPVSELQYQMLEHLLQADLHLGLYRDLEFHFGLPVVIRQERHWWYSAGTSDANSTIFNNCLRANGELVSMASSGGNRACQQTQPLFTFDPQKGAASYRSGLGDLTFGIQWAAMNQKKDESAPTWVLGLDYTAPVAEAINPTNLTSETEMGPLGDRIHRYKFFTTISKRIAFAEPYFQLHYTLPWRGPGWYDNCDNPSGERMARPENCRITNWSREDTGIRPPHVGGFVFGSEFNAFEAGTKHQKFAIDFRAMVTYVSEGRYYNEMSDLLGKLLYTGDYVQLMGRIGLVGHAAEFVHLKAWAELAYNSERNLTSENIGKDFVEEANGQTNGTVDVTAHPEEVSPLFDYRIDRVGRRFRMQENSVFRVFVQASFNF